MARAQFSEFQFAFYHAREFDKVFQSDKVLYFPTTNKEKHLGYDFKASKNYNNVFFQYKRPEFLKGKLNKSASVKKGYYKIKIFDKDKKDKKGVYLDSQFRNLKKLANKEDNVFYVTPNFYKNEEFDLYSSDIFNHSTHINLLELPGAGNDFEKENHYIKYSETDFEFSSVNKIDIRNAIVKDIEKEIKNSLSETNTKPLRFNVTYNFLVNLFLEIEGIDNADTADTDEDFINKVNSFRSYLFRNYMLLWFPLFIQYPEIL
jgi:hypothetical protein